MHEGTLEADEIFTLKTFLTTVGTEAHRETLQDLRSFSIEGSMLPPLIMATFSLVRGSSLA